MAATSAANTARLGDAPIVRPPRSPSLPNARAERKRYVSLRKGGRMSAGLFQVPLPVNEPVRDHAPGSSERTALVRALSAASSEVIEIPCVIGGEHVFTGRTTPITMPCVHRHVLANLHLAGPA